MILSVGIINLGMMPEAIPARHGEELDEAKLSAFLSMRLNCDGPFRLLQFPPEVRISHTSLA
jgi:hypothetical protein